MKLYFSKYDILKIIAEKYDIPFDEVKNDLNQIVSIIFKNSDVSITWDCIDKKE